MTRNAGLVQRVAVVAAALVAADSVFAATVLAHVSYFSAFIDIFTLQKAWSFGTKLGKGTGSLGRTLFTPGGKACGPRQVSQTRRQQTPNTSVDSTKLGSGHAQLE